MSAGPFLRAFYQLDNDDVARCRIQPDTASLVLAGQTNTIPAGPSTLPSSVKITATRREIGVKVRRVSLAFTGTPPVGYSGDNVSIPILQSDIFDSIPVGAAGLYLGASVVVLSKTGESLR